MGLVTAVEEVWLREMFPADFSEKRGLDFEENGRKVVRLDQVKFRDLVLEEKEREAEEGPEAAADAGLAQFGPFRSKSDAELLATGAGEGLGDRDEAVAIGVVFDHGEDTGALGSGAPQGAEIRPQGRKGDRTPGPQRFWHTGRLEKNRAGRS